MDNNLQKIVERSASPHVQYLKDHLCGYSKDKDYIFISYKSDDWKLVLEDIVYRLVKDYNLNIYYDGDFDKHNDSWLEQFPRNMKDSRCKGLICFVDEKYLSSFATVLELMTSQSSRILNMKRNKRMPVVPVLLGNSTLDVVTDSGDTGLGGIPAEKNMFHSILDELNVLNKVDTRFLYNPNQMDNYLSKNVCSTIAVQMLSGAQQNRYIKEGSSLDDIAATIRSCCPTVFSDPQQEAPAPAAAAQPAVTPEPASQAAPAPKAAAAVSQVAAPAKSASPAADREVKKWDDLIVPGTYIDPKTINFMGRQYADTYDFKVGSDNYREAQLNQVILESAKYLLLHNPDKLDRLVDTTGLHFIRCGDLIGKEKQGKTGPDGNRITAYFKQGEVLTVNGKQFSVGTGINSAAAETGIRNMLEICGAWDKVQMLQVHRYPNPDYRPSSDSSPKAAAAPEAQPAVEVPKQIQVPEAKKPVDTAAVQQAVTARAGTGKGIPLDIDYLTSVHHTQASPAAPAPQKQKEQKSQKDPKKQKSKDENTSSGKRPTYDFTLYGTHYKDQKLKEVLIKTCTQVMERNPDKLDILIKEVYCLKDGVHTTPTPFSDMELVTVHGRQITIGHHLGKKDVRKSIKNLMKFSGEPDGTLVVSDNFYID